MRHLKDYDAIEGFVRKIQALDVATQNEALKPFCDILNVTHDYRNKKVVHSAAADSIAKIDSLTLGNDIVGGNTVKQEAYLLLYAFYILGKEPDPQLSFKKVLQLADDSLLSDNVPTLSNYFDTYLLALYFILVKPQWNEFIADFDADDWGQISALQQALPLAGLSINQMREWITLVVIKQNKDGYLSSIGDSIYSWAIRYHDIGELELAIQSFSEDSHLQRFLGPIVTALKERQNRDFRYYWAKLKVKISSSNSYAILFALGIIIKNDDEEERADYLQILFSCLEDKAISLGEVVRLCAIYRIYNEEVYELITQGFANNQQQASLFDVVIYLHDVPTEGHWYTDTCILVFSSPDAQLNRALDGLFDKIVLQNLNFACELLERRVSVADDAGILKGAIELLAQTDKFKFQEMFISWCNSDNIKLHRAIRRISSFHGLPVGAFDIAKSLFDNLSFPEKLFVAYKIAGYVFLAEPLQKLSISLIKSVDSRNDTFESNVKSLLKDYIIYNYRSTLDLLKAELETNLLSEAAKEIFADAVETFERYHKGLQSVSARKELSPPTKLRQYKTFYETKQFNESKSERDEENSFMEVFGDPISLNSNKWAIRKPGELIHKPSELGQFEVSMEFPSGEILDPHFQEYMRKSYQKLRKHEIDFK